MSNYHWATPEEIERIKKRNRTILYVSLPLATALLTAMLTLLLN
ncbi:hypothetical protein [uncultured Metabacillus sp.]|nr:hypothetical protein [uncultured Metabacillus sp.]